VRSWHDHTLCAPDWHPFQESMTQSLPLHCIAFLHRFVLRLGGKHTPWCIVRPCITQGDMQVCEVSCGKGGPYFPFSLLSWSCKVGISGGSGEHVPSLLRCGITVRHNSMSVLLVTRHSLSVTVSSMNLTATFM
jgi:hypothetical protein